LKSIIRYFGGKGNGLNKIIHDNFPPKSSYDIYVEAFGGGANVLLFKEQFGVEIYNDLEQNVYSLFKVISDKSLFSKFKVLCDLAIYSHQLRDEYREDLKKDNIDIVERAFKYFYVNRCSVNGVGGFSIATCIRRNMSKSVSDFLSTIDGLQQLHNRLSSAIIENTDGIGLIKKFDRDRVFMYLDPPYSWSVRGSARYKVDMTNEQQKELVDVLLNIKKAKILLSGYDCNEYKTLTDNGWNKIKFDVKTQDGNRKPKIKTEVLWMNYIVNNDNVNDINILA
jgi:DNA adenine methylase